MEASVAIQVLPQNVGGDEEVCRIVDEAIAYIQSKFPDAYVGPRATVEDSVLLPGATVSMGRIRAIRPRCG